MHTLGAHLRPGASPSCFCTGCSCATAPPSARAPQQCERAVLTGPRWPAAPANKPQCSSARTQMQMHRPIQQERRLLWMEGKLLWQARAHLRAASGAREGDRGTFVGHWKASASARQQAQDQEQAYSLDSHERKRRGERSGERI